MNIRQTAVPFVAVSLLCLALYFPSWAPAARAGEASFILTEQFLNNLRQAGLPNEILEQLKALKDQKFETEDEFLMAVRQKIGNDQTVRYKEQILKHANDKIAGEMKRITEALEAQKRTIDALLEQNRALENRLAELETVRDERMQKQAEAEIRKQKELEKRVKELEDTEIAREDATRSIIRDAVSTMGSKINQFVSLGGNLEVLTGSAQVFQGQSERVLRLNTAQLDFEVQVNDWTLGSLVVEYDDGKNTLFTTSQGSEESVDRINIDTAFFTLGDMQRFPPFLTAGRMIVPFGISTGNPVHDVPTIEDPLTIEAFETKQDAILIGFGFPTPHLTPAAPPVIPPPVRPLVLNPLVSSISKFLGYKPLPIPPPPLTPITPKPPPPPFTGGVYFYNGEVSTQRTLRSGWRPGENLGATLGYRIKGNCGRPYDQLKGSLFCPWSIDIDVDYNNSVFDSRFLALEYQNFLRQIGFVDGMAASVKGSLGPVGLIAEWNGAINNVKFADDLGTLVDIKPSAWHVSFTYQFDWNPWVEVIAAQGTYLSLGYSQSQDLAGVTRVINGVNNRVGTVPERRFIASVGEWVWDGVRVVLEYSHAWDYSKDQRGTGKTAHGVFSALTYEW